MPAQLSIQENVLLAPFTTLQIGGAARFFVEVQREEELLAALDFAATRRLPVFILGGGSNVLIADEGFPGLVVRIALRGVTYRNEGERMLVTANAGEDWDELVRQCVERDLAGIECLSGIPGLVGGTPVQNVGAYGQEVSETIVSVLVFDRSERRIAELTNAQCRFNYRSSLFNTEARECYIVLAVTYALEPHGPPSLRYPDIKNFFAARADVPSLQEVRVAVREIRARKAMIITPGDPDCRSAGSFFKNPVISGEDLARLEAMVRAQGLICEDERIPRFATGADKWKLSAAWLIEHAGFRKGYRRGNVGISSKHTLAIINHGGGTAREVFELATDIQERVRQKFNLWLQPEPVFVR
jgi:UDP-N-acetylmuramate dehydrogenase